MGNLIDNINKTSVDSYDYTVDFCNNILSAGVNFWGSAAGLISAGYGIYYENPKIIIPSLLTSLAFGTRKLYKDFFSSEKEPVPEALMQKEDNLEGCICLNKD